MTIRAYNILREYARDGAFDWNATSVSAVIPVLGYVFDETHANVAVATPYRSSPVPLTNRSSPSGGWMKSDNLVFPAAPVNEPLDQILVYRSSDGMLLWSIGFPTQILSVSKPITVMLGLGMIGWCRL